MQRKQCQAVSETTQERCKRPALHLCRYCWSHESKTSHMVALFLGAMIVLLVAEVGRWVFTTGDSPSFQAVQGPTDKKPAFRASVNDVGVADLSHVRIPYTETAVIRIRVQNIGSAPSEEISACIVYPVYFTQVVPHGWDQQLSSDWYEHEQVMPETEVAHHRFVSKMPLYVGDGVNLPDVRIKDPKDLRIPIALRVWSPHSEVFVTRFTLVFASK